MSGKTFSQLVLLYLLAFVLVPSSGFWLRSGDRVDCEGTIEDFYYATKIQYSTTKQCNENQQEDIKNSIIWKVKIIASQVIEAISKEADFIATDGSASNDFCPDVLVEETQGSGIRALGVSNLANGIRSLADVSLDLDLLGGGHWRLCYPPGMYQPAPDTGMFDAQILLDMQTLETQIIEKKNVQLEEWTAFKEKEIEETTRMKYERVQLEGDIDKEVLDMEVEAEQLSVGHEAEWLALEIEYNMSIPQAIRDEVKANQTMELLQLEERHNETRAEHDQQMEDLESRQDETFQSLADEKLALETEHLKEMRRWDRERAVLQATLAHQRYLEVIENREQKRSEAISEDFASIQYSYERALEDYVSESLWEKYANPKKPGDSPCFLEKPEVDVSLKRVLTAAEADAAANMCQ